MFQVQPRAAGWRAFLKGCALALPLALPLSSQGQRADVDVDNDGLIEISSLTELHNMRYDLAGTSYKSGPDADGNSAGCNGDEAEEDARLCFGYELMENLDFDGDKDGRTWSGSGEEGFRLDGGDTQAVYFPVDEDGVGGWLPIGDEDNPFAAVFDGNGRSISNLAISRDQFYVGLFGRTGAAAAIRNIGLVDNLADHRGSSDHSIYIGGLVGRQSGGSITASYATGPAAGGDGDIDRVGGLVGQQDEGSITASYATGAAAGGDGISDAVGGLVGVQLGGSITASYATGPAAGGDGTSDFVGGLVGYQDGGSITASYATGAADGGGGGADFVGGLVGGGSSITASYGFGQATGEAKGSAGSAKPEGVETAAQLTAANVAPSWNDASRNTLDAWSFGGDTPTPALQYADYDGDGNAFDCGQFPDGACGTLLPMQVDVDVDNDGLIEISSLTGLHNMRYNLAGTSYKTSTASVGNSDGCPVEGCIGYELMQDLDFDGDDDDGGTWSGSGADGYTLDFDDRQADYFPVDEDGAGGWEPIGDEDNPFAAVFDGNGYSILNLAIRRNRDYVGLFGAIGGNAAIRNLGLRDNLAAHIGTSRELIYIGGLVGLQSGGSITASYATGPVVGGSDVSDAVGGLVGKQSGGSITASYATGPASGGGGDSDDVGGLVGFYGGGSITASYATGAAAGGGGAGDDAGGLVGFYEGGSITASYATGDAAGGSGINDSVGGLVGRLSNGSITASYGFGGATGEVDGSAGTAKPDGVETAFQLTAVNAEASWNDSSKNTLGAWDFGAGTQIPALNYADYDGGGDAFVCADFPAGACGTLLPGQRYAVVVSVAGLEVDEGGSASYSLRLASAPTGQVEVRVVVDQDGLEASPASLFFDEVAKGRAGHWGTYQRVTLSLDEDGLSSGTRVAAIGHEIVTSDPNYDGVEVPSIEVTLIDDEKPPKLILTLSPDSADEGSSDPGEEASQKDVTVMVTAGLEGPARSKDTVVTLTVGVAGDSAGEDDYQTDLAADAALIIPAAATASEPLELVVTLFQDLIDEGDESFTIRAFNDLLGVASATFVIADDDRAGVEVSLEPGNVRAGDEIDYAVVLTSEPAADVEVAVVVRAAAGPDVGLNDVTATPAPLTFTRADWHEPQRVTLSVDEEVAAFGELDIVHVLTSTDANYNGLSVDAIRLELVDVDATLQSLELRLAAAGEPLALRDAGGDEINFSADVQQYFATVPFPAASAFIRATPTVMEDILIDGEVAQRRAEVRIFREGASDKGGNVAGKETSVDLLGGEDRFSFRIEVSVQPSEDGGEAVMHNYSLTLTRALPADAELLVYLAAAGERQTPITDLDFGPDDDLDLILILRGAGGSGYSISDIEISDLNNSFDVVVNDQKTTAAGGFETPVTLSRADDNAAEDVRYSLTFAATPERPISMDDAADAADDANQLSATIAGTLKANIDTETEISATYRSHSQGEEKSLGAEIRVSANGPVTITLNVGYSSGGDRAVGPSDFSFSLAGGVAGSIQGNILEIPPGQGGQVTVEAAAASSLGERINPPDALAFTVSFESPRALIRAAADPNPLFAFSKPFFAFVGEERRLPLEVVLAAGSTPLAGSAAILGSLPLMTVTEVRGDIPATVTLADAAADDGLPGRDLAFAVSAPKNSVTVEVAVARGGENKLVDVAGLSFIAHFLSLEHPDGIEFRGDVEVFDIALRGEEPANDSWTFEIINTAEFEGHGYRVEEVALEVEAGTYEPSTAAPDEAWHRPWRRHRRTYEPSTAAPDEELRSLRVTRAAGAVNSRVVLEFKYFLDGGAAGVFTRTIRLTSGREASLEAAVIPGTLVLPKGGSGQVRLLISNLALDDDPAAADSIEITADADADLRVELQGSGRLDRINNRFEQTLEVRAAADAGRPEYTVRVKVRLPGTGAARAELRVDINDAPQYKGDTALTVYESGDGRVLEFPLSIVDPDGGMRFLDATELSLEVIGFADSFKVASNAGHANRYFDLAFSGISAVGQEGPPNGKRNSLSLTLTLSGKLATPFNSVVELRLSGVTDGFDGFEQLLRVGVKNRPPQFELAQTLGVKVFLEREPTAIPLQGLEEGAKVLVLQAPADLVVKFDETAMEVTLRRLDTDLDGNGLSNEVELVALDAQGGRTPVTIEIQRPPRLPRIVPPPPLLLAAGASGTRMLQLAGGTKLDVTWELDDGADPGLIAEIDPVSGELSLTATLSAAGREFELLVTAFVGEEAGGYRRTARLPVLVVAEAAKPRLQLSATLADPENPAAAGIVVSSFARGETLSIKVAFVGEVPAAEELGGVSSPSFRISIFKLNDGGAPDFAVEPLRFAAASAVVGGELEIEPVPVGEDDIAELGLDAGDAVRVSVGHLPPGGTGVSDEIIAGASLVLRVSEKAVKDVDNDGLADDTGEDTAPEILGPIAAAVARATAGGVASAGTGIAVSLSLGETSRLLGLGECGGVSLTLTLTLTDDGDGAAASLSGCSGGGAIDAGLLFAAETLAALDLEEGGEYRLIDLAATFDSSEAGGGGFLVLSLPLDPQQPYVVYRFDRDANEWVPIAAAGLPGQAGLGGGGALADFGAIAAAASTPSTWTATARSSCCCCWCLWMRLRALSLPWTMPFSRGASLKSAPTRARPSPWSALRV